MENINQENEETLKQANDSLRKEHLEEWVIDIKNSIIKNQSCPSLRSCCIYRAHKLRDLHKAAFTPKIVSIGPLRYFDEHLKGMEATKIKFLERFLQRADNPAGLNEQGHIGQMKTANDDFPCLVNFLSLLQSLEKEIRSSYAENLNHIASKDFFRLILVDAAFIIELFLTVHFERKDDNLVPGGFLFDLIRCDLWLLENQLPFFVLKELYHSAFGSYLNIYPPFHELSFKFFQLYNHQKKKPIEKVNHFTDLIRIFFLPSAEKSQENEPLNELHEAGVKLSGGRSGTSEPVKERLSCATRPLAEKKKFTGGMFGGMFGTNKPLNEHLPCATQLRAAGVKFRESKSKCLFDIKFSNGRLEIPSLHLFDETGVLFRNLIALEQYHYPEKTLISNYFTFMDYLVDTSNDADLLVEKKIIKHWLGSGEELANLFNSLCVGIVKESIPQDFHSRIEELNKYHDQVWHRWQKVLTSRYFSTPWRSGSTIAAIILLALTLAQTILSGIALLPGRSGI